MPDAPLTLGAYGAAVARLQELLVQQGAELPSSEVDRAFFGPITRQAVQQYQRNNGLPPSGELDANTARLIGTVVQNPVLLTRAALGAGTPVAVASPAAGTGEVTASEAVTRPKSVSYDLKGQLVFDYGLPAAGVKFRLYDIGFAGKDTLLHEGQADASGSFAFAYQIPTGAGRNIQLRVVDPDNMEITVSATKYGAAASETLNVVVPGSLSPLAPEHDRISADLRPIGGPSNLVQAVESTTRQDLTLLNQTTGWDARLLALASTAAKQTAASGLSHDVLYTLFRSGLPSDPATLAMAQPELVKTVLTNAARSGIVNLNSDTIAKATDQFQAYANKTLLATRPPGMASSFGEMVSPALGDGNQQAGFLRLYLNSPTAPDFWKQAAALRIPSAQIDQLKLQGKLLFLTLNNAKLAAFLQHDIGTQGNLTQLADRDFHLPDSWKSALQSLGGGTDQGLQQLIPPAYQGATTADRLAAYAGDLARKVRMSFPTRVVARMVERQDIPLGNSAPNVTGFLRQAEPLGYALGRTPLNAFLNKNSHALPQLGTDDTQALKRLHRLFQVTPSSESLQAAVKLGFKSARDIAAYGQDKFIAQFGAAFPAGEAEWVFGQAQVLTSVTFNIFAMAKQLDNAPPIYAVSGSDAARQNAKNAIVQQFPSMASLFGNLDYCACEECQSVLSPAAYFVDVLEFLNKSAPNAKGYTPLDVLIGSVDGKVAGRRPDLGALPLTCENTGTAMPYIDLVNEILEYYIANSHLDANLAYDTGPASTAELAAEPQHVLPGVYNTNLKQTVFPLALPFDLWIETVRGFLGYFRSSLAQVLETLRPIYRLELFSDASNFTYYRAQILAEALGISPAEYEVFTGTAPGISPLPANWFKLYGYPDEATALNGKPDPANPQGFLIPPLKNAATLSRLLGLSYQQTTDLVTTGFLNPSLFRLMFQFTRFRIEMGDAFSYTGQAGYPAMNAAQKAAFEVELQAITARYKAQNPGSTFDAKTWLVGLLPAGTSRQVLVLASPDSGCDFTNTTLQYADGSAATQLDFIKFNLFARLWPKLGWSMDEIDRALQAFFPSPLPAWGSAGFGAAFTAAWKTALVYLAHLDDLTTRLQPALGRVALLPLWGNLPVNGANPLYASLFLTPSVLNSDWAFDDPRGLFPSPASDLTADQQTFAAHLPAIQGAFGLTSDEVTAVLSDAGARVTTVTVVQNGQNVAVPSFTLTNLSICYTYAMLAQCLLMDAKDLIALKAMSGLNPFNPLSAAPLAVLADDVLFNQTLQFVTNVRAVQASGFTVEDLQYLLRHQFDPVGKYQIDQNALLGLAQSIATGLQQIAGQNAVPPDLGLIPDSRIDQSLSRLLPEGVLKTLFTQLTNAQTYTASQGGVAAAIDPTPFAQEPLLGFSYDATTQTQSVSFRGFLPDWKKTQLEGIAPAAPTASLFKSLLDAVQVNAQTALDASVTNILGAWASLAQYEAVKTGTASGLPATALTQVDPAVSVTYDQADQLQWLGYRGVLTDAKKAMLKAVALPATLAPVLAELLDDIQQQAMPAYSRMAGSLVAMATSVQTFVAAQTGVAAANQVDAAGLNAALASARQNVSITATVPTLQFSYDAATQTETLVCQGVLTASMQAALAALLPGSATLASLLAAVRAQAVSMFQSLAANLLTVTTADLDTYAGALAGTDIARQQKIAKGGILATFLPLVARKLSRDFLVRSMAASFGADPSLTDALMTDAALLSDPNNPGKSLMGNFLDLAQPGLSAAYFTSVDTSGAAQTSGIAATADTADPTNSKLGTQSARFDGYLQVTTDGPYRFYAELGNTGAAALFQLVSPDPTALLTNPVIPLASKAAKNHDEVSQFVELKGGALYQFTLEFHNLGPNGASLLVQGETLPKGPLSQVLLYPADAIAAFTQAKILLGKALQILGITGLTERELSYLVANASLFSNLKLSALPTQQAADTPAKAVALFAQFLTLADYSDLRKGPAGGTDGLVDVFQNVGQTFTEQVNSQAANSVLTTPWTAFANLTRRDPATVRTVATYFGFIQQAVAGGTTQVTATGDFGDNKGIRRIWQALQLVQIVGIPVASLTASTVIASLSPPAGSPSPDVIAANFKNAVKSQYTNDAWLPIAKSVFDKIRKSKRDALVAYLVQELGLDNSEQLFEYFLVDPGMQPVVQTSRLRLAMSSLQTFVQRCLLNMENANNDPEINVGPNAIDADWWAWMKRYRVWQANRKIFLYPENWMIPELRLDQTDLFQTLAGTLLQGDVNADSVEDAMLGYLKGLDAYARLDIVATYLDQNTVNPGLSTLYVLGRTHGSPPKYYFRTYFADVWSAWTPVTPDIEGDHVTLVVWRGRLHVLWVTFIGQPQPTSTSLGSGVGASQVSAITFEMLMQVAANSQAQARQQLQLHRMEYLQGKWSNPVASDLSGSPPIAVTTSSFDPSTVRIRVSKETAADGSEGALDVHLDFPTDTIADPNYIFTWVVWWLQTWLEGIVSPEPLPNYVFRVTGKNCHPQLTPAFLDFAPPNPYNATGVDATMLTGSGSLSATFTGDFASDGTITTKTEAILSTVKNYAIVPCANTIVPSPFLNPSFEPNYAEAGSLVAPFFYKDTAHPSTDNELTFFVQPSLTETLLLEWEWWAVPISLPIVLANPQAIANLPTTPQVPVAVAGPLPPGPGPDPAYSRYQLQNKVDWVTQPATVLDYGGVLVNQTGGINVRPSATSLGMTFLKGRATSLNGLAGAPAIPAPGQGLTVVGARGLSPANLAALTRLGNATPTSRPSTGSAGGAP
jgi:peptidoglycan hydrolase-like protein with peptidoglycan-binding domain